MPSLRGAEDSLKGRNGEVEFCRLLQTPNGGPASEVSVNSEDRHLLRRGRQLEVNGPVQCSSLIPH